MIFFETKIDKDIRERIIVAIEDAIEVPRELWEYKRSKRSQEVLIRHVYIYFLNKYTKNNIENIAKIVGLKNHCTIIQTLRNVNTWLENPEYEYEKQLIDMVQKEYTYETIAH
jgi:chromosomal replication initiation ATPase DnaA